MLSSVVIAVSEGVAPIIEEQEVVTQPPYVYGLTAIVILMALLLLVSRLDLDR